MCHRLVFSHHLSVVGVELVVLLKAFLAVLSGEFDLDRIVRVLLHALRSRWHLRVDLHPLLRILAFSAHKLGEPLEAIDLRLLSVILLTIVLLLRVVSFRLAVGALFVG